jgi:hypothetical protein
MVAILRQLKTIQSAARKTGEVRLRLRTMTGLGMLVDREAIKRCRVFPSAA